MDYKKILLVTTLLIACGDDSSTSPHASESSVNESSSSVQTPNSQGNFISSSTAEIKSSSSEEIESNTELKDPRDGQVYPIVDIEMQRWLNRNMNYASDSSWCYNDVEQNCDLLGRAYNWESAKQACPDGYRLPTSKDWNLLEKLIATSGVENKGEINYVMTGRYSEYDGEMSWNSGNKAAYFWDLEEVDADHAATSILYLDGHSYLNDSVEKSGGSNKSDKQFVRCIRENKGTLVDPRDGQTYKTIRLGNTVWMQENLNFAADSSIEFVGEIDFEKPGRFYTHSAALTACPAGWHLPSADDFNSLIKLIESHALIDYLSLKSDYGWKEYDRQTSADDFEFTALPVGNCRYVYSKNAVSCHTNGQHTSFWTNREIMDKDGYYECAVVNSSPGVGFVCSSFEYNSIRCVKD